LINTIIHVRLFVNYKLISYKNVRFEKIDAIIAPDMGAVKKAGKIADELKVPLIVANKVRDLSTGKILKYEILNATNIPDNVFIVDDICDGGATFLLLAEELKNLNKNVHISSTIKTLSGIFVAFKISYFKILPVDKSRTLFATINGTFNSSAIFPAFLTAPISGAIIASIFSNLTFL
jgi:phosphoribosylpyrophosphate synthetase